MSEKQHIDVLTKELVDKYANRYFLEPSVETKSGICCFGFRKRRADSGLNCIVLTLLCNGTVSRECRHDKIGEDYDTTLSLVFIEDIENYPDTFRELTKEEFDKVTAFIDEETYRLIAFRKRLKNFAKSFYKEDKTTGRH